MGLLCPGSDLAFDIRLAPAAARSSSSSETWSREAHQAFSQLLLLQHHHKSSTAPSQTAPAHHATTITTVLHRHHHYHPLHGNHAHHALDTLHATRKCKPTPRSVHLPHPRSPSPPLLPPKSTPLPRLRALHPADPVRGESSPACGHSTAFFRHLVVFGAGACGRARHPGCLGVEF